MYIETDGRNVWTTFTTPKHCFQKNKINIVITIYYLFIYANQQFSRIQC